MNVICDGMPKARKEHECGFCGRVIRKGEHYRRQFNKETTEVWTWKNCAHCDVAASLIDLYDYGLDEGMASRDSFTEFEPESVGEEYLLECFRAQWTYPSGRLMPIPTYPEE
ncbi:hypothetical protein SEA_BRUTONGASTER_95 [Gordonia phage BrutonGaster]|uniref:Uncharacterized protein n=1 Tax=Gordonia phage BrutonGaster TaxID=2530116 RepID=A0A482JMJ0_9CAUD|nr:hypothetical protein HOV26_gp087 [Gordonia phage BrutonGaster]QBP33310.1 hypothetical protein SEA_BRUTONGASTER_95 [Gordonia phage BrutonGaster]